MKNVFALAAICMGLTFIASAQNANPNPDKSPKTVTADSTTLPPTPPEPEWSGAVYLLSGGKLVPLESQRPQVDTKVKALGFGGGTMAFVYQGPASSTRSTTTEFVVRLGPGENPAAVILLSPLQQQKGARRLLVQRVGGLAGGLKSSAPNSNGLDVNFSKYGTNSVKIVPATPLPPGEYAFRTASGITYLFGVDDTK